MIVRRALPSDDAVVHALHRAAFGRDVEADLFAALRRDGDLLDPLCLAVEADGAVVGHVATSAGRVGGVVVPAIGPIGVLPGRQRHGIGSALMHAVTGAADALGEQCLVLLGSTDWYPRFGFGPAAPGESPDPAWGAHFQVRRLTAWDGSVAGRFAYAAAFDGAG